jgi:Kef-type K+ transport system membrane component KefB
LEIARHVAVTLAYFGVSLTLAPRLLKRLTRARWNVLRTASPVAYTVVVMLAYIAIAAALDVSLVFAAFLAGVGAASDREVLADALAPVTKFSFAVFIPLYFLMVGYRLDLGRSLSLSMVGALLLAACAVKLASVMLAARCAGFTGRDALNLAVATNARGGPGIVLASVALDAGIVSAPFYTALVLLAVLTSQAAGAWLDFVLHRGWPLLSPHQPVPFSVPAGEEPVAGLD